MGVVNYKFNGIDAGNVESLVSTTRSNNAVKRSGKNIIIGLAHEVDLALGTASLTYIAPGTIGNQGNVIDWGDGTIEKVTSGSASHTYATSGVYEVRYYGDNTGNYSFQSGGERVRVISITDWTNFVGSNCSGFANLVDFPSTTQPFWSGQSGLQSNTLMNGTLDHWDVSTSIPCKRLFKDCSSFNQPINSWNVSNKTDFLECFRFNYAFNQPLSNWNMSSAISVNTMFQGAQIFNQDIGNWRFNETQKATGSATSTSANALVDSSADFVSAGVVNNDVVQNTITGIIGTVTSVSATTLSLSDDIFVSGNTYRVFQGITLSSTFSSAYAFNNGGIGGVGVGMDNWTMKNVTTIGNLFGLCRVFNQNIGSWDVSATNSGGSVFNGALDFNKDIGDWQTQNWVSISIMFNGATDYNNDGVGGVGLGIDKWDLSRCTNTFQVFQNAEAFDQYLGSWDVSNSTSMTHMFKSCSAFSGQGLGNWDISSSQDFDEMFFGSPNVNFAITHPNYWEINPKTTTTNNMFQGTAMNGGQASGVSGRNCEFKFSTNPADSTSIDNMLKSIGTEFNQDISTDSVNGYWEMDRVVSMSQLLSSNGSFNQNLGNWSVGACTNFGGVFSNCGSFNNGGVGGVGVGLDSWDVSSGLSFAAMFQGTPFAHTLESWDVSSATSMGSMFRNNSSVPQAMFANWNVGNVTNFSYMFEGQVSGFVPQVSSWNTSSATNMQKMFAKKLSFELDLSGWNTSLVQNMSYMFESTLMSNASSFSGTVSGWSIASLTNAQTMFNSIGPGTTAYDQILDSTTGWASQATIQSGVSFSAGTSRYTAGGNAEAGRNILTGTYGWTITDGGPV